MTVLLSLGAFKFEVTKTAHSKLSRKSKWRWSEITRLGGKSALHYTGKDSRTVELDATMYSEIGGEDVLSAYERLEEEADKGEPLLAVDGMGFNLGRWVIEDLSADETNLRADGSPRKITFKIGLRRDEDS